MPRKRKAVKDVPPSKQLFRYWVELRDRREGSMRTLPLSVVTKIHIPRRKNDPQRPAEQVLRLQDESVVLEGKDIDDIAAQLRGKYPDETYERFLHRERDYDAERRKAAAVSALAQIIAEAVAEELLNERGTPPISVSRTVERRKTPSRHSR